MIEQQPAAGPHAWWHRGTGELRVLKKNIGIGICVSKVLQCQVKEVGEKRTFYCRCHQALLVRSRTTWGRPQEMRHNFGYGLCCRQRTLIGKDCSHNAKERTEHRPVKAFVNRISFPIIVTGLSNFIFHNSSGKRPVLT